MKSAIRPHCDVQQAIQQIEQINHHHTQIHDPLHHIWEWKVEENTIQSEKVTYSSYSVKEENKTKQNLHNTNQPTTTSAFPLCPFLKKRQLCYLDHIDRSKPLTKNVTCTLTSNRANRNYVICLRGHSPKQNHKRTEKPRHYKLVMTSLKTKSIK